ncbi:MAG: hypothetical protein LBT20_08320 [Clostridiales bacterium]|jgi:hypothetical protein|nr:hypothetical protein [Clostridiales bacterium]
MKKSKLTKKRDLAIRSVWAIVGLYTIENLEKKAVEICLRYFPQADETFLSYFKEVAIFAQEYSFTLDDFNSLLF